MTVHHTQYTWEVRTVPVEKAKETLDELTRATHEVYAIHLLPSTHLGPPDLGMETGPQLLIIARQSSDVARTLMYDEIDGNIRKTASREKPVYRAHGRIPSNGIYSSKCGCIQEYNFKRGEVFNKCPTCGKAPLELALLEAKPMSEPEHV